MSIPSQSQSSPVIHFANVAAHDSSQPNPTASSSSSAEYDSQQHFLALVTRPQSTPISSPRLILQPSNFLKCKAADENSKVVRDIFKKRPATTTTTVDYSTFTDVTPLNNVDSQIDSSILWNMCDDDLDGNRFFVRPPPLMVLSQIIQSKHPDQLTDTNLNNCFSSIKDLPNVPANYYFVFYRFTSIQLEEAKRLARRMGDCFTSDVIDLTTTHVIVPNDDPLLTITLDFILAIIYGCRVVTLEWLQSSSRIGDWVHYNRFEPKQLFNRNAALNMYRKARQQQKSIDLFNQCGFIYLTSLVRQRQLLVKLITLLGGNITICRNRANVVVGHSSKPLQLIVYPQVDEQWAIDSINAGKCLSMEDYLITDNNGSP